MPRAKCENEQEKEKFGKAITSDAIHLFQFRKYIN